MKRIIVALLLVLVCSIESMAQFPLQQNLGSSSTLVQVPANGGLMAGLINRSFTDTTAANSTYLKGYAGAQILTTSDSSLWFRNQGANMWVKYASAAGGSSGGFWAVNGNYLPYLPSGYGLGTNSPDNLPFKTNGTQRVILPSTGLAYTNDTTNNKVMTWNPSTLAWGYGSWFGSGGGGSGFVPYVGATSNVYLGNRGLYTDNVTFKTSSLTAADSIGRLKWDTAYGTLKLGLAGGNVQLQVGQEQVALVHNGTGSPLTDGQVVYITGSTGQLPSVSLASDTTESSSSVTFGVVTEPIANGANGYVTVSGMVHGLNTLAYTEGAAIWLGVTPGTFTETKPVAPKHAVLVGYVVKKSGGNGSIFVKIQNGYELNELHNVKISSPVYNKSVLMYDSTNSVWVDTTIASAGLAVTSVGTGYGLSGGTITTTGTIIADTTNSGLSGYYLRRKDSVTATNLNGYLTRTSVAGNAWALIGNSGTDTATNFVGTTDAKELIFKTNNIERVRFDTTGKIMQNLPGTYLTLATKKFTTYEVLDSGRNTVFQIRANKVPRTVVSSVTNSANMFIGDSTGINFKGTGYGITVVGGNALQNATTSDVKFNTVVGANGLKNLTSGISNTVMGQDAAYTATTGFSWNTVIGNQAAYNWQSGTDNVVIGQEAAAAKTSGSFNTLIGYATASIASGTGNRITAIGYGALRSPGTATANSVAVGFEAGRGAIGTQNMFLGYQAGANNGYTGNYNVYIGNYNGTAWKYNSNVIAVSDMQGNLRYSIDSAGRMGYGTTSLDSFFKNAGSFHNTKSVRFSGLPSGKKAKQLFIDTDGTLYQADSTGTGGGSSGTVTSVATGYGLSGGTITTTGTIIADTTNSGLSGYYLRRKDSVTATNLNGYLTSVPTWQQTLTAGSTLTGANTIAGGSYNFTFGNMGLFTISQTAKASVNGSNGTAHVSPLTVTGGNGGATSYSTGTVSGGNAGNVSVTAGNGGAITGTPTTGIGGTGGYIDLVAGDGGLGTTFGGTAGFINIQGGTSGGGTSAGSAGYVSIKGGMAASTGNGNGGDIYLIPGAKNGSGLDGHMFLGVSPSLSVRGSATIGSATKGDSLFNIKSGGLYADRGVRFPNTPSFADTTNYKPVVMNSSGTLYKATYWPGGGGSTSPSGNYGNLQINRNGAFATPASDSLSYTTSGGLVVKNKIYPKYDNSNYLTVSPDLFNGGGYYQGLEVVGSGRHLTMSNDLGDILLRTNYSNAIIINNNHSTTLNYSNLSTGDVTIKGQTDNNLFWTDASADEVYIGTNTDAGAYKLQVSSDIYVNGLRFGKGNSNVVSNTAIGVSALNSNTSGNQNVAVGYQSLFSDTSGINNTAVGYQSLYSNLSGSNNVAVGLKALYANTTGSDNLAIGTVTQTAITTGQQNVSIGRSSISVGNPSYVTSIGHQSLQNVTGNLNTAIGWNAGINITSGTNNTVLGAATGYGITTGSYNTIIGSGITGLSTTLSNTIIIADGQGNKRIYVDNAGSMGVGNTSPDSVLTVTGGINVSRGARFPNTPLFADTTNYKPVVMNSSGTLYKATYWPGGGGSTSPSGNYGNLQINRNGSFATPASDSLSYTTAGGLNVKNVITGTTGATFNTGNSSTGNVTIKGQTDNNLLWTNASANEVYMGTTTDNGAYKLQVSGGAYIGGVSQLYQTYIDGSAAFLDMRNSAYLQLYNNAYFKPYQQPLIITRSYPTVSPNTLQLDNDIVGGSPTASTYKIIQNKFSGTEVSYFTGDGGGYFSGPVGFGVASPTAKVHLPAGTATANTAPLKFTSGTLLTTPEVGALEFQNGLLYLDSSNSIRDTIATRGWARNNLGGGQQDTISLASFGAGGGNAGDTVCFSTSTIYGSFYNDGSDTLVITSIRAVVQGSSASITPTVYYNDSLNVTAGATKLVNSPSALTNTTTGVSSTPDNSKIPPGVWVWVSTGTVTTKPTYFSLTLLGYKKRK